MNILNDEDLARILDSGKPYAVVLIQDRFDSDANPLVEPAEVTDSGGRILADEVQTLRGGIVSNHATEDAAKAAAKDHPEFPYVGVQSPPFVP